MTARCSRAPAKPAYFVVMKDLGKLGQEAASDPEWTRDRIISLLNSGEFGRVSFIDYIAYGLAEDVTDELINAADLLAKAEWAAERASRADQIAFERDHVRGLRKEMV